MAVASGGRPKIPARPGARITPMTAIGVKMMKLHMSACRASRVPSAGLSAPTAWATRMEPPVDSPASAESTICMIWIAAPAPARAAAPSAATRMVLTMSRLISSRFSPKIGRLRKMMRLRNALESARARALTTWGSGELVSSTPGGSSGSLRGFFSIMAPGGRIR